MIKRLFVGQRLLSRAALSSLLIALAGAATISPAEARRHHHGGHRVHVQIHARHHAHRGRHHDHAAAVSGGATAAIAVDGATGHILWGMNEHEPRHPASVTKVMTLYLLFEQLEKGKISLDDEISISAHAAAQAPSKLGLRPGSTIRVEDAIKAVVTKSANDIAVAIAEAVGGTESEFAEQMTHKAHALGMNGTTYRNASGLPNSEQITTAYDLAILGRDIQARFPRYYRYFSLHEFAFHGQRIHNHNHLMDRVEGMDGIKTGYTVKSGFNLLSSVHRDGHHLISVVLGGKSAHARDAYMERLIEAHIDSANARGPVQVARNEDESEAPAPRPAARAETAAPVKAEPARIEAAKPETLHPEPLHPEPRAVLAEPPRLQIAAVIPDMRPRPAYVAAAPQPRPAPEHIAPVDRMADRTATAPRRAGDGSTPHGVETAAATPNMRWTTGAQPRPKAAEEGVTAHAREAKETPAKETLATRPAVSGWTIQIGATDDAGKAEALLKSARAKRGGLLASARPYTEIVHKGKETLYRARFAGMAEQHAEAACKALKSFGFSCFATRN